MNKQTRKCSLEKMGYSFNYSAYGITVYYQNKSIYEDQYDPYYPPIPLHLCERSAMDFLDRGLDMAERYEN